MSGILEAKPKVGYFYKGDETGPELNEALSIIVDKVKSVPVVIDEETTVYDAAVTMFLEDVGTIFVVKDNLLKGVISRKDLLKATLTGYGSYHTGICSNDQTCQDYILLQE